MKSSLLFAVSLAALGLAGCKNDDAAAPVDAASTAAADAAAMASDAAVPNMDQDFADTASASDTFEIQTSQLALEKASSPKVKQFAQEMIKAHTDSSGKLKAAAASATPAITPMPRLTPAQQQTLTMLQGQSGAAFDTAYMQAQAEAHQMTLDRLKSYAQGGGVPAMRTLAGELVPVVTAHLNMAKSF